MSTVKLQNHFSKGYDLLLSVTVLRCFLETEENITIDFNGITSDNMDRAALALSILFLVSKPEEMRRRVKSINMPSSSVLGRRISFWRDYIDLCNLVGAAPESIVKHVLGVRLTNNLAMVKEWGRLLGISITADTIDTRWKVHDKGGVSTRQL